MMAASTAPVWQSALASTTARQFRRAVGLAVLAVGVGCLIYLAESCLVRSRERLIANPASAMMRAVGLAHFWIGWLFLLTSPKIRSRRAVLQLFGWAALGAGLCVLCHLAGAARSSVLFVLFYGYFLLHEVLDEARLFRAYGDWPAGSAAMLSALTRAAAVSLLTVLATGYLVYGMGSGKLGPAALGCLAAGAASLGGGSIWVVRRALCLAREEHGGLAPAVAAHAPLLLVYAGLLLILLIGTVCGSVAFNFIILVHAGSWFLFIHSRLGERPAPAGGGLWAWLRGTPAGFIVLHAGVVVAILALLALRVHVWERSGLVSQLLAASSFPYWSLMHITIALWRPR